MKAENHATVLSVSDLAQAKSYYIDTLGFELDFDFEMGQYAGVKMDGVTIHLTAGDFVAERIGKGSVYIFCDEIHGYFEAVKAKGANVLSEPADQPYMMRDFTVVDPDGNMLSFGQPISPD
ncbi:MAG: VOC family protein [Chloroflexota bacterium]